MTPQEQTRRQVSSYTLKTNRDQLTRALQGVRTSIQQFVQNRTTETLMADAAAAVERLSQDRPEGFEFVSEAWHATDPVRTFTYEKTVPGAPILDEDGDPVLDGDGEPTFEAPTVVTKTETLVYDAGKRFVYEDSTLPGKMVYFHQGGDAPSVREEIAIVHAFMSYAFYNGEMEAQVVEMLIGLPPLATEDISGALDAWA